MAVPQGQEHGLVLEDLYSSTSGARAWTSFKRSICSTSGARAWTSFRRSIWAVPQGQEHRLVLDDLYGQYLGGIDWFELIIHQLSVVASSK